ncbi:MAG: hypothetical protein K6A63_01405 [Acholeplasmatales bacterium]|nr:hypothetical protein [Acholeplasmatales bacterium]
MEFDLDFEFYATEDLNTGYMKLLIVDPINRTFKQRTVEPEALDSGAVAFMSTDTYDALVKGLTLANFKLI